jgi:hypothetical protein
MGKLYDNSDNRMSPTWFEKIARLIAEEEGDVQWLVNGLRG